MKLTEKELKIIKDLLSEKLHSIVNPGIPESNAKEIAYMTIPNFNGIDPGIVYSYQLFLRKIIDEIYSKSTRGFTMLKKIETPDEYEAVMTRIKELMDKNPNADTSNGKELVHLSKLAEEYEQKKWPIS